jgi:hypothetical protein
MVGATHVAASTMPPADMRYRECRDQKESVAGNGNGSLTDGRKRPHPDVPVNNSRSRKRTSVHHNGVKMSDDMMKSQNSCIKLEYYA